MDMTSLIHLKFAVFGLAMIRPTWSANSNGPDDPDPAGAALPPSLEDELREYEGAPPSKPRASPPVAPAKPRAITNKRVAKVYHFPRQVRNFDPYVPTWKLSVDFAKWMVANGHTEPLLPEEVDNYVMEYCEGHRVRLPDMTDMRSEISNVKGVDHARRRVKHPKYDELRLRTNLERPVVYEFTKRIPQLNGQTFDAMDSLTNCGTACDPFGLSHDRTAHGKTGPKIVSRNKKAKKAEKNRPIARKKNTAKSTHYAEDSGWGMAA